MKTQDFVVRFAGEGGQGVVTSAEALARMAAEVGYHVQTFATFPSQIEGGPTWTQARIAISPVLSPGDALDVLVALNRHAYEEHYPELRPGGVVMHDASFQVEEQGHTLAMPFTELAKQAGEARSMNMVILGALAHLISMPRQYLENFVRLRFKGRDAVIEGNLKAVALGFEHAASGEFRLGELALPQKPAYPQLLIRGNDALAVGAMAAGVDCYIGYPISPATPVLVFMERNLIGPGKFAYQASSEIEAISAVLGAGFAGKKAMSATSGPGLSLMSEGIGLAWMAEIPLVIVDVQRGGPATGMPTKTEQSDFFLALTPAHGDSMMPIIAPGTVEECLFAIIHAFNWAERYQGPVIVLSEQTLAERVQNIPKPDLSSIAVEGRNVYRGGNGYLRYDGWEMSPMPVPGGPGAYVANGSEHDPFGDTTHLPQRHVQMTERRFSKLKALEDGTYERHHAEEPIALMPWGASKGPALEAYNTLSSRGVRLAWYYTMYLHPLPPKLLQELQKKELVLVPELNYTGQFSSYLRSQGVRAESVRQYTGLPFKVRDLVRWVSERVEARGGRMVHA
ncbi:MAG: 2-oxoacid:acceptor oxidoreductase subunit alpha [Chloroflexi bacterium]|nr:2-oxoacid:acceptor oxidoreductase subunit alpha [Chloroflexota bacterium]